MPAPVLVVLRLLVGLVAAVLITSCGTTVGSGTPATETRPVADFTAVELATSGVVFIEQSGWASLEIDADDNILPLLTSDVWEGTLVLDVVAGSTITYDQPVEYRLTVADLEGVALTGSGDVTALGIAADTFWVELDGSGSVTVSGTADEQSVGLGGAGDVDGSELAGRAATVDISGSGTVTVGVDEALDVDISGSGTVIYLGDPAVTESISGSGEVVPE
jgi:hypothetical protein